MLGLGNILTKGGAVLGFPNKYSFNFDGSNDYIEVQDTLESVFQASYSISLWLKADDGRPSSDQSLFGVRTSANSSIQNTVRGTIKTNGKLFFRYHDGSNVSDAQTNSAVFSDGATDWTHITIVVSESTDQIYIYVNGSVQTLNATLNGDTSALTFSNFGTSNNFPIGGRNNLGTVGEFFSGLIDEFAIWDTALSADDVAKIASKPVDLSKPSKYATDRTSNLKLWLRAGDKAEPESTTAIARQDFYTDFSASNDYIDLNTDFESWIESPNRSFTTWVKNGGNTDEARIFNVGYASNATGFAFGLDGGFADNIPFYFLRDTSAGVLKASFGDVLNTTDWYHFAITINDSANEAYLYQNGILKATVSNVGTPSQTTDTSAKIGGFWGNGLTNNFNGQISNMALYQTTLDAQTISQMAKSRFTPMRDNRFSVVDFDGSNDYIDCGSFSSSVFSDSYDNGLTMSAWFKTDNVDNFQGIVEIGLTSGSHGTIQLAVNPDTDTLMFRANGAVKTVTSSTTIAVNTWYYVSGVFDGSSNELKIYINGSLSATVSYSSALDFSTYGRQIDIGRMRNDLELAGSISSVSIYNTAKSAEEVYAIYQQGITYDESSLSGLVGYWRMGDDTSKAYPTIADSSSNSNDGTMISNGASDDIVQQMVAGYDLGAFESSSEELGGEIASDNFGGWTLNGWTDNGDGTASANNSSGGNQDLTIYYSFTEFIIYKMTATFSNISGTFYYNLDATGSLNKTITTNGEHILYVQAPSGGSGHFFIRSSNGSSATISNVSIKEVLQSEVSDTHPAIIDVTEPVLGAEIFPDSNSVYTVNTHYQKDSATPPNLIYQDTGTGTVKILNSDLEESINISATYKLTFTISGLTSGQANFKAVSDNFGNTYVDETMLDNGTHTFYFTRPSGGGDGFLFRSDDASGSTFIISNYSLKRVFGNVGTMTNQDSADLVYSSVLPDQSFLTGVNSAYNFIDLDGSNEYIDCGAIDISGSEITLSAWVYRESTATDDALAGKWNSNGSMLYAPSGGTDVRFHINVNVSTATLPTGAWTHVVGTLGDGFRKLYINGEVQDTDADTNSVVNPSGDFYIGRGLWSGGKEFLGNIGQVAYYNKMLTATEVSAIYTLGRHGNLLDSYSDNLKGYWAMSSLDAKTGLSDVGDGTIYDRSGNSNHGTATNTESADLKSSPNAEPNGYAKGDTNRSTTTP